MAAFHFSINTCTMNEHGNMQFTCSNASTIPGSLILLGQAVARIPEDDRRAADLAAEQCKSEWERYNLTTGEFQCTSKNNRVVLKHLN